MAHRYWRVRFTSTYWSDGTTISLAKLKLKDTYNGTDRASGLTGAADSSFSGAFLPANAFDSDPNTIWNSSTTPIVGGHWISIDFGLGVTWDIVEIEITVRNDLARQDPKFFIVEYSDDNTNWFTSWSVSNLDAWTIGSTLIFNNQTTQVHSTQEFILTAINYPTAAEYTTQAFGLVVATPVLSVRTAQAYALVAIMVGAEERMLRAWTFTQDDHDFYVLQAAAETYLYDKLSEQWCQWSSPDAAGYWRGADGCDWEGINVCIDPDTGKLFKIDPDNRLDYTTTPIVSEVFGGMTERFRNMTPCYMAEVAISQARPPAGIDATTVGIKLETYDTISWTNHGTLQGQPTGNKLYARFYGLGLLQSPGVLFKITDTGYARRIDGLNISMGGVPDGQ